MNMNTSLFPPPEEMHLKWIAFANEVFQGQVAVRLPGMWWSYDLGRMLGEGVEVFDCRADAVTAARAATRRQIAALEAKLARLT
ncbi:MAG TPA: hypothetical protein PLI59_05590 [Candidatus Obscuribacter sp.]|nr:hypothetical protein [Candidatus Obscuribacter sp.]HMY51935.1 hypothetical protein [Candidatus Obscuribacter sp.]HNG18628.1 hypothetical protein [Candidatus Obscuribacter sp.]HNG73740.1 hypothetical protein [Candidatus Obscuribacter sp.]